MSSDSFEFDAQLEALLAEEQAKQDSLYDANEMDLDILRARKDFAELAASKGVLLPIPEDLLDLFFNDIDTAKWIAASQSIDFDSQSLMFMIDRAVGARGTAAASGSFDEVTAAATRDSAIGDILACRDLTQEQKQTYIDLVNLFLADHMSPFRGQATEEVYANLKEAEESARRKDKRRQVAYMTIQALAEEFITDKFGYHDDLTRVVFSLTNTASFIAGRQPINATDDLTLEAITQFTRGYFSSGRANEHNIPLDEASLTELMLLMVLSFQALGWGL